MNPSIKINFGIFSEASTMAEKRRPNQDDLQAAWASVDWAQCRLPDFAAYLETWLEQNIEKAVVVTEPPATYDAVVAREKARLPLVFSVEAGAYVNAIRSSLDILACTVGRREMTFAPDDIYFPVADSMEDFRRGNYRGSKFMRGLSADSRLLIESFKPYRGGNETLWALHKLDITRKHKRLLDAYVRPAKSSVRGWGLSRIWQPVGGGFMDAGNGETVLGLLLKGAQCPEIRYTAQICFNETASAMPGSNLVKSLGEMAQTAREIIMSFDTP